MDSLGITPRQAAKALRVTERTVYHWLKHNKEPYIVRLALFWLSPYGFEIVHTEAHNKAQIYYALSKFQADRIKQLEYITENFSHIKKPRHASNDEAFTVIEVSADNT